MTRADMDKVAALYDEARIPFRPRSLDEVRELFSDWRQHGYGMAATGQRHVDHPHAELPPAASGSCAGIALSPRRSTGVAGDTNSYPRRSEPIALPNWETVTDRAHMVQRTYLDSHGGRRSDTRPDGGNEGTRAASDHALLFFRFHRTRLERVLTQAQFALCAG